MQIAQRVSAISASGEELENMTRQHGLGDFPRRQSTVMTVLLVAALSASPISALEADLAINAYSEQSDNTLRTVDNPIAERHDFYSAELDAKHQGDLLAFDAQYSLEYFDFAKNSQPDREAKRGRSSLDIGGETDTLNLHLEHSVQLVLRDPSEVVILSNLGERNIYSARPQVNLRLSGVDNLVFGATRSEIDYKDQPFRNSSREGYFSRWQHRLDKVSQLGLQFFHDDVSFDDFADAKYSMEKALLQYSALLRNIRYTLAGGYNRSDQSGETLSGVNYSVEFLYTDIATRFAVSLSREITDSSRGSANRVPIEGNELLPEGSFVNADQLQLSIEVGS